MILCIRIENSLQLIAKNCAATLRVLDIEWSTKVLLLDLFSSETFYPQVTDASLPSLCTMLHLVQLHIFSCGLTGEGQVCGDGDDGNYNCDDYDVCSQGEVTQI